MKRILACFLLVSVFTGYGQSVFSEGEWYKLSVGERGVYKIDQQLLSELGVPVTEIDPRTIQLFGNGGQMLSQPLNESFPLQPHENHIYTRGFDDGRFDPSDYLVFFASGPDYLEYREGDIYYEKNNYDTRSYYFLTFGDENGKRIASADNLGSGFQEYTTFDHLVVHERDEINLLLSGREFFGEVFDRNSLQHSFKYEVPGWTGKGKLLLNLISSSQQESSFELKINQQPVVGSALSPVPDADYDFKGLPFFFEENVELSPSQNIEIEISASFSAQLLAKTYLDFFILELERSLSYHDQPLYFRKKESTNLPIVSYEVSSAGTGLLLWDVTDPLQPRMQEFEQSGDQIRFSTTTGSQVREFVLFDPESDAGMPAAHGRVGNHDLLSINPPDLLIVSHPDFMAAAQRLGDFRSQNDGLDVQAVDVHHIYDQFSSGSVDISAIRNFVKYLYDKSGGQKPGFLLLMGDASYDIRQINPTSRMFIPAYQSYNSLHPISTFSSDDYFALLEDEEGAWEESNQGTATLDLGVGRLPFHNPQRAMQVVQKIINYDQYRREAGQWKREITLIADDGDNHLHLNDAERLSRRIDQRNAAFEQNKLFLDAFEQENLGSSQTSEQFKKAFADRLRSGSLIVNFTGHGSENQWMDESVLTLNTIRQLDYEIPPLFVTATCQFGRHDYFVDSGAEELLKKETGGAIALLTTSRPVYSSSNLLLNQAFYNHVFSRENGAFMRLGEILKRTKNESQTGTRNRNFILLGDPSMKLAYPTYDIKLEENDVPDTLSALSLVKIRGQILEGSRKVENFNGELTATIYDKPVSLRTKGDESRPTSYESWDTQLFKGKASVVDGEFELTFRLPRNIDYSFGKGKMVFYASDQQNQVDAAGGNVDVIVGGDSGDPLRDDRPPRIDLYVNDTNFTPGGRVYQDVRALARISDENGISIRGGIGQQMVLTLDDSIEFEVNEYFYAEKDNYQAGWVEYDLGRLAVGKHTYSLRAWDNLNNTTLQEVSFYVSEEDEFMIQDVFNYPNPVSSSETTTFSFSHNRSGDDLKAEVQILDHTGAIVDHLFYDLERVSSRVTGIQWSPAEKNIRPGLYFFQIYLRSDNDGRKTRRGGKMVIIN